jgi:hypothetical protein
MLAPLLPLQTKDSLKLGNEFEILVSLEWAVQNMELFFHKANASKTEQTFVAVLRFDHVRARGKIFGFHAIAGAVGVGAATAMRAFGTGCAALTIRAFITVTTLGREHAIETAYASVGFVRSRVFG